MVKKSKAIHNIPERSGNSNNEYLFLFKQRGLESQNLLTVKIQHKPSCLETQVTCKSCHPFPIPLPPGNPCYQHVVYPSRLPFVHRWYLEIKILTKIGSYYTCHSAIYFFIVKNIHNINFSILTILSVSSIKCIYIAVQPSPPSNSRMHFIFPN